MGVKNNILLLGGSGNLGKLIVQSNIFKNIFAPTKKKINILNKNELNKFIIDNNISIIINCAAVARQNDCEKNPLKAKRINIDGTMNLVNSVKDKKVLIVQISSDAVYGFNSNDNKETDTLLPYNVYGCTKYHSEKIIKLTKNYIIIRTRFFIPDKKFPNYAIDIINSAINIYELPKIINLLLQKKFRGTINIGSKKNSNYGRMIKLQKNIKKTNWINIIKNNKFIMAKKTTMNLVKMKKILGKKN